MGNMKTINDRIIEKSKELGLKQTDIIQGTSASKGTVSKWFNGLATPSGKKLVELAKFLKTSSEWLTDGIEYKPKISEYSPEYNITPHPLKNADVPVISLVQAGDWTEAIDPYPMGEGSETLQCPYPHGENTFAVQITGQSMSPEFPEGMIIFIDPSRMPENKEYCIAKLEDTNEATFKQYVVEDGQKFLKATNLDWPTKYIPINGNCCIIGRLIGVYLKY